MKYEITVRFSGDVSKMDAEQLARHVDGRVEKALARSGALQKELAQAESQEDRSRAQVALVKANAEIDSYMDEQRELMVSHGMKASDAFTHAIVPTGETFVNRYGNAVDVCRIVKRGYSLEPNEINDGCEASVRCSHSYSQGVSMSREARRGKYNDAALLIDQSSSSVDASEVVPFSCACVNS